MKLLNILLKESIESLSMMDWYHGTNSKFDTFDMSYFGKTDQGWWGEGIYFHSDIDTAKAYGREVKKVRLNFKSPIILPVNNSNTYLYNILKNINPSIDTNLEDESAMNMIRSIGSKKFSDMVKEKYDSIVIKYAQGTIEVVVLDYSIIIY